MWELDNKEVWVMKNWRFQTVVLRKTLESPLVSKEMKPVNPYQVIWYSDLLKNIPQFVVIHTVNGEKESFTHLNTEFQKIASRNEKAFLSDQC